MIQAAVAGRAAAFDNARNDSSLGATAMEWTDEGIVLGVRRHGETSAIVELITRGHGRHLGVVRGGAGNRLRPILQPGNAVSAVWRARLDEHLGTYALEGIDLRAARFITLPHALYGLSYLAHLVRLLPERDPHRAVFEALEAMLTTFDDASQAAPNLARFELLMLTELGFGLDLSRCAATGGRSDLIYVSPKSGCAVSRDAGEPWRDRLLRLPAFLAPANAATGGDLGVPRDALTDAYELTGFFLARHVLEPRGLAPIDARRAFIAAVCGAGGADPCAVSDVPEVVSGSVPRGLQSAAPD